MSGYLNTDYVHFYHGPRERGSTVYNEMLLEHLHLEALGTLKTAQEARQRAFRLLIHPAAVGTNLAASLERAELEWLLEGAGK